MEEELKGLLGLNKMTTQQEIIAEVKKMVIDLRGKMGYRSIPLIEKLKRDGYLKFDYPNQVWLARISNETMEKLLSHQL